MIQIPAPLPGRPLFLNVDGGRLYISVHDAFYLERQRAFKRQIRLVHPDRNRRQWACSRTRNLLKARARWEAEEARWYARFGLEPPTRLPQRISSVGNPSPRMFASPPTLPPPPAADRHPSGVSRRRGRASLAIDRPDHHNFADPIGPLVEQDFTPSVTETCHSPPDDWPDESAGVTIVVSAAVSISGQCFWAVPATIVLAGNRIMAWWNHWIRNSCELRQIFPVDQHYL